MFKQSITCITIASTIFLSACSKDNQFKAPVQNYLSAHDECIYLNSLGEGMFSKGTEEYNYKGQGKFIITEITDNKNSNNLNQDNDFNKLNVLTKLGILSRVEIPKQVRNNWTQKNTSATLNVYSITPEAQKLIKITNQGSYDAKYLCYAKSELDQILNFTEQSMAGQNIAQVKYSYKYVDVAPWATNPEFQKSFPEASKKLNNKDKTGLIILMKTNNGWQTSL